MGQRLDPTTTHSTSLGAHRLLRVRLALLTMLLIMLPAASRLGLDVPVGQLAAVIVAAAVATLVSGWRGRRRADGADHRAVMVQLSLDVAVLTAILYLTGGWTNPLVSLYLVPVALAAVTLPTPFTWGFAALVVAAYSLLTQVYRPLSHLHGADAGFSLHVTGMWLTFVISALLIAYFGTSMAATLRRRERALAEARERNLRNEQIMAVATLAAGTAHELSTPLGTIAVIASELEATTEGDSREDLRVMLREVAACRDALNRLRQAAAAPVSEKLDAVRLLEEIRDRFALLRPAVKLDLVLERAAGAAPQVQADPTLRQALLNLVDNAADASPDSVEVAARWRPGRLEVDILDRGPGFAGGSDPGNTAAAGGMGMGLLLANATIERLGGTVYASAREGGGTRVRVVLPATAPEDGEP